MENLLLQEIVVIFGLSIAVLLVCHRLKIPSIVGFLITGIISGPHGLALVGVSADVQMMADIGVVLLLFSVGLEFSVGRLLEHKRFLLLGGALQVLLTTLVGLFIGKVLGKPTGEAIFLGFLLSLSSTAIVLRTLESKREMHTPHGKAGLGILIFQDIAAVPMMLLTPYLASSSADLDEGLLTYFLQSLMILAVVFYGAIKLVPRLMHMIARTRSRELFLLTTLTVCFSVAWVTAKLGLSLPLGAFLAGLIVSESEYRNEAVEDILPFQDVFISFFFISIGMLLDMQFFLNNIVLISLLTIGVMLMKGTVVTLVNIFVGLPIRTAFVVGLMLSQVGEFSFVLSRAGIAANVASDFNFQLFLAVAIITMALTPWLIRAAPKLGDLCLSLPLPERLVRGRNPVVEREKKVLKDHVLILGFGLPGQVLASACLEAKIPHAIIDMDSELVVKEREKGRPIYFGDATHARVLSSAGAQSAQAVVILINDPVATIRIIEQVRRLNEDVYIIVRTSRVDEMRGLFQIGADDVIPDEFGSSIEIFTRILKKNDINPDEILRIVAQERYEEFDMMRLLYEGPTTLTKIADLGIGTIKVAKQSQLIGKQINDSQIKENYHVNPVMIRRGGSTIMQFDESVLIEEEDIIVIVGPEENLRAANKELSA